MRRILWLQPLLIVWTLLAQGQTSTLSITTGANLPTGVAGASYSLQLSAKGGESPYTWAVTSGALPQNFSLSSSGLLSGNTSTAGTFTFGVKVTDNVNGTASRTFHLTINPALTINTASPLPNGVVNSQYSQAIAATGGFPPYLWWVSSGNLPPGLNLDNNSGTLSGIPLSAGSFTFTVQVFDQSFANATQTFAMTVNSSALVIATGSPLPAGNAGSVYLQVFSATGGTSPYSWSVASGTLPTNLALDPSTGTLTGMPATGGTYNFTVKVTDSTAAAATKPFSLTINGAALSISTGPQLPSGTTGVQYSQTLTANGGTPPYSWAVTDGALPSGLTLNAATGAIGGIPAKSGTFSFEVTVKDSASATATKSLSLTISAPALSISTGPQLPNGSVGAQYSQTLVASGGTPPYSWSLKSSALPSGLSLSAATGTISGIPTTAGTFNFQISVKDSAGGTSTKSFSLQISPPTLSITSSSILPNGSVNVGYSQQLTATGGLAPYTWSLTSGALPPGLALNGTSGLISGAPTTAGIFLFSVQVHDSGSGTATQGFSLTINAAALAISGSLGSGEAGIAYSQTLTAVGGTAPYQWSISVGTLPTGVRLDPASGVISGLPQAPGSFSITVQVRDAASQVASSALQFVVAQHVSISNDAALPSVAVGANYLLVLASTGGVPPYLWSLSSGSLPPGLVLTAGSGAISGKPTTGGHYTFGVQVQDSLGGTATKQFTLNVGATLAIGMTSLPGATLGAPYAQNLIATGGTAPYTWTLAAGALPPGVSLNPSGSLGGVPSGTGTFTFTLQAADAAGNKAAQQFSILVAQGLTIATTQLLNGTVNTPYSQTLNAAGGAQPYYWSVIAGSLPPGLSVSSPGGVISGTPTLSGNFSFTVRLTDAASLTATQVLKISVGLTAPVIPQATITGLAGSTDAAQQVPINVQLSSAYPFDITGQITASFASTASVPADDPSIQFATGGRTVDFTIPANTQQAVFPVSPMALQTGTVEGTITLTIKLQSAGASATTATQTIQVTPAVPAIRGISLVTTSTGFEVHITGLSNTREVSEADLRFQAAAGSSIQTSSLFINLSAAANQWYQSAASVPFGSQFVLVLPFNVQGGVNSIASVSVILKNSVGSSVSSSATF